MKRKNIWSITLSLCIIGLLLSFVGCSKDEVLPDGDTPGKVYDIDGNEYKTGLIGNQIWMAENLRVTRYLNGDLIPTDLSDNEWSNTFSGAYAIYPHGGGASEDDVEGINSSAEMVKAYGKLYNWFAVDDSRGLCPAGWHIPSDDEWTVLQDYLGGEDIAAGKMKSTRTFHDHHPRWDSPNVDASNESGFSALPGGRYTFDVQIMKHRFVYIGRQGGWWSSTKKDEYYVSSWYRSLYSFNNNLSRNGASRGSGYSIRCIKD